MNVYISLLKSLTRLIRETHGGPRTGVYVLPHAPQVAEASSEAEFSNLGGWLEVVLPESEG